MKKAFLMVLTSTLFFSCGKSDKSVDDGVKNNAPKVEEEVQAGEQTPKDPMDNKGIGPIKNLELPEEVDQSLADKGQEIYETKCTSCHKPTQKFIGPAPKDILNRRTPEWVMNMILNPEEMIQKDPIAKKLLADANGAPMANQGLTEEEARAVLEYFRTIK